MKEIYLAMDKDGQVMGFSALPMLGEGGTWFCPEIGVWYNMNTLNFLGIDVTKFQLTHSKPIKIRAIWEQINE